MLTDIVVLIGGFLQNLVVYEVNGLLLMLYSLSDHIFVLVGLVCAAIIAVRFDAAAQELAGFRPRRHERCGDEDRRPGRRRLQAWTVVVAVVWLAVTLLYPNPVPFLGMSMWLSSLAALALLPTQREPLLFRVKSFVFVYALALLGFKLYLWQIHRAEFEAWAGVLGTTPTLAHRIVLNNTSIVTTIGMWGTWFLLPFAHVSYLVQLFMVNRDSLLFPLTAPERIVEMIRGRES